ncbi:MAG: hypothetical protein H0U91_14610 [Rubrobacter sp.]|nr:hypothetical protein [Rubrobacter sp.]
MEELEREYGSGFAEEVEREARRLLDEDPACREMVGEEVSAEQLALQTALVLVLVRREARRGGG